MKVQKYSQESHLQKRDVVASYGDCSLKLNKTSSCRVNDGKSKNCDEIYALYGGKFTFEIITYKFEVASRPLIALKLTFQHHTEQKIETKISTLYTKISLTELVEGFVLLILPIHFNALKRTRVWMRRGRRRTCQSVQCTQL